MAQLQLWAQPRADLQKLLELIQQLRARWQGRDHSQVHGMPGGRGYLADAARIRAYYLADLSGPELAAAQDARFFHNGEEFRWRRMRVFEADASQIRYHLLFSSEGSSPLPGLAGEPAESLALDTDRLHARLWHASVPERLKFPSEEEIGERALLHLRKAGGVEKGYHQWCGWSNDSFQEPLDGNQDLAAVGQEEYP